MTQDDEKRLVGEAAARHVEDGMTLGLGTGSTVAFFAAALGARIAAGLQVRAVPTSAQSRALAETHGIPMTELETVQELDLAVDGADEVAADLSMIKGAGSALLHEKNRRGRFQAPHLHRRLEKAGASPGCLSAAGGGFPLRP